MAVTSSQGQLFPDLIQQPSHPQPKDAPAESSQPSLHAVENPDKPCFPAGKPPLWLCIELPRLPLQAAMATMANRHQPIAIIEHIAGQDCIVNLTRAAKRCGVSEGMRLSQAYALAPQLQSLARDIQAEQSTLWQIAEIAYQFSAQVGVWDNSSVLLELGRSLRWLESNHLLRKLRKALAQSGWVARLGIAPSAVAARLLSKREQHALDHHQAIAALRDRPLNQLPFTTTQQRAMRSCGLKQLGDLLRLESRGVRRRFGHDVAKFLASLQSATLPANSPSWRPYHPPQQFRKNLTLPAPSCNTELVKIAACRLLDLLHTFLLRHDKALISARLILELDQNQAAVPIKLGLRRPSTELPYLQLVLTEKLDRLQLAAPVVEVELISEQLSDYSAQQIGLLEAANDGRSDIAVWFDQLTARLGDQHVLQIQPIADHRPERSWKWQSIGRLVIDPSTYEQRPRPAWLLPKPTAITNTQLSKMAFLAGPERFESGWWDGRDCRRDYFVVRDCEQRKLWIFRDLDSAAEARWFVHGMFG